MPQHCSLENKLERFWVNRLTIKISYLNGYFYVWPYQVSPSPLFKTHPLYCVTRSTSLRPTLSEGKWPLGSRKHSLQCRLEKVSIWSMKDKQDFLTEQTSLNTNCLPVWLPKSPLLPLSSSREQVFVFFTLIARNPSHFKNEPCNLKNFKIGHVRFACLCFDCPLSSLLSSNANQSCGKHGRTL